MSFLNHYHGDDSPRRQAPGRVYGRVDSRGGPGEKTGGRSVVLIDSVDADWFDERGGSGVSWFGARETLDELDWNVSVVEAEQPGGLGRSLMRWLRRADKRWVEIEFGQGERLAHYLNLFEAPLRRDSGPWRTVPSDIEERLEQATGLNALHDATERELMNALGRVRGADAVAVYDVGQGACTALLARTLPSLYFDFGGGTLANLHTFPTSLRRFCMSRDPPIVLSHWDWDHWSSARRDTRALERTWIVPRQQMGAVHTVFLGQILAAGGQVLVWPNGLPELEIGALKIEACTGPPSSRNNSGLAMIVRHPNGSQILLPGDCRYNNVPSARGRFTSIVVPHHGGRTRSTFVPSSDGRIVGRCVYSVGANNQWQHPFESVVDDHAGVYMAELSTADRDTNGLGHVHLYWDQNQPDAHPGCGGHNCDLSCHQR